MKTTFAAVSAVAVAAVLTAQPSIATAPLSPAQAQDGGRCRLPGPYELPHAGQPVNLRPDDFTTKIDNVYWPMRPGTIWRYVEKVGNATEHIKVRVTHRTKMIRGIKTRVVRDTVTEGGELVEDTRDWFAQDSGGSLWYLGENTKEYDNGEFVGTEGSFEYGKHGAQAGVIIPAESRPGCAYREEFKRGEAEDRARILSTKASIKAPTGFYHRMLNTANITPLEPKILEHKFYARHVGPVLELGISPKPSRAVLVKMTRH
ncbi:MAG: hypothetical protein ACR2FL_08850 [Nocardioidaceae bacterium]|nr:hypothetical protein [Nocardioidaceae bacterium]